MFGVTILGNNSALPAFNRHPTSQALTHDGQVYLIDAGEGTQLQLARYKVRRSRINHIFISHLHGDHYFGLVGLITSMGLMGRHHPLHVYAPAGLENIIRMQLNIAGSHASFEIHFHEHSEEGGMLLNDGKLEVKAFPVQHRIPCYGFTFKEIRQPRKIDINAVQHYNIAATDFSRLQAGQDFVQPGGEVIPNKKLTLPNVKGRMYAYSADTLYDPSICQHFTNADLLYHESTYLHELHVKAGQRFHSTAKQAALIAEQAQVKHLLLGHFSSQYETTDALLEEARKVFPNTDASVEGVTYRM
jgi:ribonuclease Z